MQKFFLFVLSITLSLGLFSCRGLPEKHWSGSIPQKIPAVIVPSDDLSPQQILEQEYIPFLDDITSSAEQLVSEINTEAGADLQINALMLYPGVDRQLQTIWLLQAPDRFAENLHQTFFEPFSQNKYDFHGQTIYRLYVKDRIIYASQLHDLMLLSESSLGIEDAIRSYLGLIPPIDMESSQLQASSLVLNTPSLDRWIDQVAQVQYRPYIRDAFKGTGPVVLDIQELSQGENSNDLRFTGNIPLTEERSELIDALSSENAPVTLDRYISSNASSFAIFRLPPRMVPPDSVSNSTRLDSLFLTGNTPYAELARSLDPEFAQVTYTESGFLSPGEHLYLRKLNDRNSFVNQLEELAADNLLQKVDGTYYVQSKVLGNLVGSELNNFSDFYLNVTGDAAVISRRRGLVEVVESDRNRRRVIYYDQNYMDIRGNLPDEMSGYVFANTSFYDFIETFLNPETYVSAITSQFNQLTMTFQLDDDREQLAFEMRTYTREESDIPYEEQWYFPTEGAELSGEPVFSDLRGSSRDEIIFATTTGSVYALATDGTTVMQADTEDDDEPIGSPVVYDWYGTDQQVILLAAGNKIYGWNDNGTMLPRFPFVLDETITTPLTIADIDQNGLPEAVVATADRQLQALDGRGSNISGWPVTTNSTIREKPVVDLFQGNMSVVAFSENAVHAWNRNGSPKANFPSFINASLNGSPLLYEGNVLGAAADGYLYAVGGDPIFPDSVNVYSNRSETEGLEAVYVSNSALVGTPSLHSLTVQADEQTYQEEMILTMSSNGSLFLINSEGQLRLTTSMGQPAAQSFSPFISDIDGDGDDDIIGLASFGRLYAWQVADGERLYSLPTSGMQYPAVTDLNGDGNKELIAQTSEGLRCWTIYDGHPE